MSAETQIPEVGDSVILISKGSYNGEKLKIRLKSAIFGRFMLQHPKKGWLINVHKDEFYIVD